MGFSISNYPGDYSFICAMTMFKGCSAVKINGRSRMKHNSDPDFWWPRITSILCGRGQVTAFVHEPRSHIFPEKACSIKDVMTRFKLPQVMFIKKTDPSLCPYLLISTCRPRADFAKCYAVKPPCREKRRKPSKNPKLRRPMAHATWTCSAQCLYRK